MPIRKIARIVDAAYKDSDLARSKARDPGFAREVAKDRRGALSSFKTVKHALADRERMARGDGRAKPKASGAAKAKKKR